MLWPHGLEGSSPSSPTRIEALTWGFFVFGGLTNHCKMINLRCRGNHSSANPQPMRALKKVPHLEGNMSTEERANKRTTTLPLEMELKITRMILKRAMLAKGTKFTDANTAKRELAKYAKENDLDLADVHEVISSVAKEMVDDMFDF